MKGIMIAAPSSGSGKTTVTMGLIRALVNKGKKVTCFKTGPDYIDTAFLKMASKQSAGNLDMHLQGRDGMLSALSLGSGDICVIEGAMGYFDGVKNTLINSSYDIARSINVNTILVYTPKGEMFSAIPKIKGMVEFENSNIKGIILNKVSIDYYKLLKEKIEEYIPEVAVLGYIPKIQGAELESRHLGLVQSIEQADIDEKIELVAEAVSQNVDLRAVEEMMTELPLKPFQSIERRNLTAAVAFDSAFAFYYRENIELLERAFKVEYFSPLQDKEIPECDFLYLGGGYPEVFQEELSNNKTMLASIKEFAENGGCIYAECGGLMYLTECIEENKMVGVFRGASCMTHKLQRFGYIDIIIKEDCIIGRAGSKLTAHEFHKSISEIDGEQVFEINKTMGEKSWECGYTYKNVLAGYPHINFLGNIEAFKHMVDFVTLSTKIITN